MPENILGISDDYMGNVTLLSDGRPIYAAANERFSRKKGDAGFPDQALEAALQFAGLTLEQVDHVVVANRTHFVYRLLRGRFKDYAHDFFNLKQKGYLKYHDLVKSSDAIGLGISGLNRLLVGARVKTPLALCDHHVAHACSGIASSGCDECLVVSIDNIGDGYSAKVHSYRGGRLEFLYGSTASNSPGQFYGEVAQILGFNPLRHAGKVTGLSASGDPEPAYPIVKRLFGLSADREDFWLLPSWQRWKHRGAYWKLGLFAEEDVAAAAQRRLEEVVAGYVQHALKISGHRRIVLAGGVFANVKLNLVLWNLPEVRELSIHPAMSDEGLSMGAAFFQLIKRGRLRPEPIDSIYLGGGNTVAEQDQALRAGGLEHRTPRSMAGAAAALLARGHVVARFDDRFAYGPRALGNRSILYRPDDPSVNNWLNQKLKRTESMPFAPVTLWEQGTECYLDLEGIEDSARFMTIALNCTPSMKERCPGVVHLDGTARPQLLRRGDNPGYYDILAEYHRITGLPCLINTSFNMHEDPIAGCPKDAVRVFKAAEIDYLVMGSKIAFDPRRTELRDTLEHVCTGNK